jgi:hypothetical protein
MGQEEEGEVELGGPRGWRRKDVGWVRRRRRRQRESRVVQKREERAEGM